MKRHFEKHSKGLEEIFYPHSPISETTLKKKQNNIRSGHCSFYKFIGKFCTVGLVLALIVLCIGNILIGRNDMSNQAVQRGLDTNVTTSKSSGPKKHFVTFKDINDLTPQRALDTSITTTSNSSEPVIHFIPYENLTQQTLLDTNSTTSTSLEPVIHFVTYGSYATQYHEEAVRLTRQANETGWFDSVTTYSEKDLPLWAATKYKEILQLPRGGGYWIWRYPLLQKKIEEIQDNEFVLFLDSDMSFKNYSYLADWATRLQDANQGILFFAQPWPEEHWTTEHIFSAFNISLNNTSIRKSGQLHAGVQFLRKCQDLDNYFQLVFSVLDKDPWLITDIYNEETKQNNITPSFVDNRHDQSISSVAQKVRGGIIEKRIYLEDHAPFNWFGRSF